MTARTVTLRVSAPRRMLANGSLEVGQIIPVDMPTAQGQPTAIWPSPGHVQVSAHFSTERVLARIERHKIIEAEPDRAYALVELHLVEEEA